MRVLVASIFPASVFTHRNICSRWQVPLNLQQTCSARCLLSNRREGERERERGEEERERERERGERERERERERDTPHTQTERERHTHTDTQTDKQRQRETEERKRRRKNVLVYKEYMEGGVGGEICCCCVAEYWSLINCNAYFSGRAFLYI